MATRQKNRPKNDFLVRATKLQRRLPGIANESGRITAKWMQDYAKGTTVFEDIWKYQKSSPGPLRQSIKGTLSIAAKPGILKASVDISAGYREFGWTYNPTGKRHSTDEYARRIELGFKGTDSLGRNYSQDPRPFIEPTQVVADKLGIWAKNLKRQMALQMRT
jgi:hypothetical protein